MENGNIDRPHFVKSHDFHGDSEYIAWIQEIKTRYQRIRSRIALQTNYGALEFNWLLGRDLVEKKAEQHWGAGVVEQISLDLRAAYPDVKGFSSRNLWYMKQWYLFYRGDAVRSEKLHQLGAELQSVENHNPVKLHQLGAEMVSPQRIATILDNGEMLPLFGVVPWKHHVLISSKCKTLEEAFYYLQRTIDEALSRNELEDMIADDAWKKQGKALTNFNQHLDEKQGALATNVLKDPYNFDFVQLRRHYDERDLEQALAQDITRFLLELGSGFTYVGRQPELVVSGDDYFPDMLFYHIRLRCYVVIELKVVEFMPEFAGKLNFYVSAVNRLLRQPDDNPTIGLLICKSKDQTKVEWAFDGIQNPMGVATYQGVKLVDKLPSVQALQERIKLLEEQLKENDSIEEK
jgi:predicted nuclease of restriction endonuclease-like (RecB) superfamily